MIHLITGLPGSGKSLLAVELILQNRDSEKIRPLYSNISGLDFDALRCFPLEEIETWYNLPDNSIIVVDECQRWFRPRPNGSTVPEYISRFETHRHHGHDIILITQHPKLIDANIRRLVELHQHQYRAFGLEKRRVFEWNNCNEDPEPSNSEKTANKVSKPFNKELFQFYQSATVHTHKKRIPWNKIALAFGSLFFAVGMFGWVVYSKVEDTQKPEQQETQQPIKPTDAVTMHAVVPINPVGQIEQQAQPEPINRMVYRGHQQIGGQLVLFLENPNTGQYYSLEDFTGYRREGLEIIFYLGEFTYRAHDRELLALLP